MHPAPARVPGSERGRGDASVGNRLLTSEIVSLGRSLGLDEIGIAAATPFTETRLEIERRKAAGLHAGMSFTFKNPERSTDPGAAVAGAKAIVVGARCYLGAAPSAELAPDPSVGPAGRVARYAWSDHYAPLRAALWEIAHHLRRAGYKAVAYADDNSLVDREAARRAGIGWYGKNANIHVDTRGSWFVLGGVVTTAPLAAHDLDAPSFDGCGPCTRCLTACPTGAIVEPGVIDARRCLAWVLQSPDPISLELREAVGDRIYGCDDCQDACPLNRAVERTSNEAGSAVGDAVGVRVATDGVPAARGVDAAWVSLEALLRSSDDEILARHGRWYVFDRDVRYLRRNALVALGNVGRGHREALALIDEYRSHDDALLAEHAAWAYARLVETSGAADHRHGGPGPG